MEFYGFEKFKTISMIKAYNFSYVQDAFDHLFLSGQLGHALKRRYNCGIANCQTELVSSQNFKETLQK